MRNRGVHPIECSVLDYERSIAFYDRMFGWLGYKSFWTLDIGYRSTYYMARFPFVHSDIGIQPAQPGQRLHHEDRAPGIHHVALWARRKKEVDEFHVQFLLREAVAVTDAPTAYPIYAPGYYAVFFVDPTGIQWELAYTPYIPMPWDIMATRRAVKALRRQHPEWTRSLLAEMHRRLPGKRE